MKAVVQTDQAAERPGRHIGDTPAAHADALPRYHRTVQGNFRPLQTPAARAYLCSVTATGVPILLGSALLLAAPTTGPNGDPSVTGFAGGLLVMSGVMVGPMIGTYSLGAGETVDRSFDIMLTGIKVGSVTAATGLGVIALSVLSGPGDGAAAIGGVLFFGGAGVLLGSFVVAGAYHFATIPANARWAQRAAGNRVPAREVRVSVAPGYDPRFDAPTATLRVAL